MHPAGSSYRVLFAAPLLGACALTAARSLSACCSAALMTPRCRGCCNWYSEPHNPHAPRRLSYRAFFAAPLLSARALTAERSLSTCCSAALITSSW